MARKWRERALLPIELVGRPFELALIAAFTPVITLLGQRWLTHWAIKSGSVIRQRFQRLLDRLNDGVPRAPQGTTTSAPTAAESEACIARAPEQATIFSRKVSRDHEPDTHRRRSLKAMIGAVIGARRAWYVGSTYVFAVLAWASFTVMNRVDSAVRQMTVDGRSSGSALGFAVSLGDLGAALNRTTAQASIDATQTGWQAYVADLAGPTVLRNPFTIIDRMVRVDFSFVLAYALLITLVLAALNRANLRSGGTDADEGPQRLRRRRMISGAGGAFVALVIVDVIENWQLSRSLAHHERLMELPGGIAVGPLMTFLKPSERHEREQSRLSRHTTVTSPRTVAGLSRSARPARR